MTDPITDMLNRITSAQATSKESINLPFSRVKQEIATVLKREGFIVGFEKKGKGPHRRLEITLKYRDEETPAIQGWTRISKPSQRYYTGYKTLFATRQGYGISIISTPAGIMSDKEERKKKVGGEVFCEVW